jgi:hypothetical protein
MFFNSSSFLTTLAACLLSTPHHQNRLYMNHAELVALVVQREKEGKVWVSIPTEVLKELLTHYKPEGQAVPWIGNIYSA